MSTFDPLRPFESKNPALKPPERLKDMREKTIEALKLAGINADIIRVMTETFFIAGMNHMGHLIDMVYSGELSKDDMFLITQDMEDYASRLESLKDIPKGGD